MSESSECVKKGLGIVVLLRLNRCVLDRSNVDPGV